MRKSGAQRGAVGQRTWRLRSVIVTAACCASALAGGPAEHLETWDGPGTAGWTNQSSGAAVSNPGGHLNMTFAEQTRPEYAADVAHANVAQDSILLTNLSFRFLAVDILPSKLRAYVHARESGNVWQLRITSPVVGEWVQRSVAVDYSAGWSMGPDNTREQFLIDVASADEVGIYMCRHGKTSVQDYGIDDFTMQGLAITPGDGDGDGMPDIWEEVHGLNAYDPRDASEDPDGDDMSNYAEFVAVTDPWDAESVFAVEIDMVSSKHQKAVTGIILRWDSATNRIYNVWRSSDPAADPFTAFDTGIQANPPQNEYEDITATNAGPQFYLIEVEEQ